MDVDENVYVVDDDGARFTLKELRHGYQKMQDGVIPYFQCVHSGPGVEHAVIFPMSLKIICPNV